jgi:UTP-glucose-1-phosphate uridylyltransferase
MFGSKLGLGHAVLTARELVVTSLAVLLADDGSIPRSLP